MKNLINKILTPQIFALAYLPWLAINMVSVINILSFTRVILILFALWGVFVSLKMYFSKDKGAWTHKSIMILLVFLAACLFSEGILFKYGGFDALGKLCYFALCIVILYSQYGVRVDDYAKVLGLVAKILGIVIGISMLVSDWMFLDLFKTTIVGRSGATITVGFSQNRLFGLYSSPNVGGMFAIILVWCSIITFHLSEKYRHPKLWKAISIIQILLGMTYISVALSNGTYLSGSVFIAVYMILRRPTEKEKLLKIWKQVLIRIFSIFAVIGICALSLNLLNFASCELMTLNYNIKMQNGDIEDNEEWLEIIEKAKMGSDGRVEAGRDDIDITNKRASIWMSHLQLLKGKNLIIGVNNPEKYYEHQLDSGAEFTDLQNTFIPYASGNMHNGFLQILVNCGLIAFIPMMFFIVCCAIKVIKYLIMLAKSKKDVKSDKGYHIFMLCLPLLLAILSNNLVETNFVLMGANFIQAIFWFVAGVCVQSMREETDVVK